MVFDTDVIDYISGRNALLDAQLLSVSVNQASSGVNVDMKFKSRFGADLPFVYLEFTDVDAFSFTHNEPQVFLEVWELKFLRLESGYFYLTLDPDPSTLGAAGASELDESDTDQFWIRARHVKAAMMEV